MNVEVRITSKKQMEAIKDLPFDIVGIGNEYCPHKLCDIEEISEIIDICKKNQKKFRIVTAFLSNKTFNRTFDIVEKLANKYRGLEIVVNDYGFLKRIENLISKKNISVIMGQMLVHSIEEFLWVDDIVGQENDFIKNNLLLNGFANKVVIDSFKKSYNFKSIIINYLPHGMQSADYIKKEGIGVSFVDKYYTMGVARKCHVAMYNSTRPSSGCNELCNEAFKINISRAYDISNPKVKYKVVSNELKSKVKDWIVFGNAIFREYENELDINNYKDDEIILDYRYYSDCEQLNSRIQNFKNRMED